MEPLNEGTQAGARWASLEQAGAVNVARTPVHWVVLGEQTEVHLARVFFGPPSIVRSPALPSGAERTGVRTSFMPPVILYMPLCSLSRFLHHMVSRGERRGLTRWNETTRLLCRNGKHEQEKRKGETNDDTDAMGCDPRAL